MKKYLVTGDPRNDVYCKWEELPPNGRWLTREEVANAFGGEDILTPLQRNAISLLFGEKP